MMKSSPNIWQIQAETHGRLDFDFFVTPDNRYSIYYSGIEEYGMMKFVSPVQIWADRDNPRILFQSRRIKFEYQNSETCYYLQKSDVIVLLTPCVYENFFNLLYVLFDFNKNVFAIINAPNFQLNEVDAGFVRQKIDFRYSYDEDIKLQISKDDGKVIDLALLKWHDIKLIDKTCSFVTINNR